MLLCAFLFVPTVSAEATSEVVLTTDKTIYVEGEPIMVTASSPNANNTDWVGITVKGDKEGAAIYWEYIKDANGSFDIKSASRKGKNRQNLYDIPAGEYVVFIIPDDLSIKKGYDKALKMIEITVVRDPNKAEIPELTAPADTDTYIVTDKDEYIVGESVYVLASSTNASTKDWVGIWPKGESGASIYWEYITSVQGKVFDIKKAANAGSSRTEYYGLPEGEYTLYIIPNDMKGADGVPVALARKDITVKADPTKIAKAPTSATYELKNATDGMADGTLTITLPEGHGAEDIYMWWGNENGKLEGYTRLARFKVSSNTVVHEMTANTIIPAGATKLLIYTYNDSNGLSESCYELSLPAGAASGDFGEILSEFQVVGDIHVKGDATTEYGAHFVGMLQDVVKNSPSSVGIFTVGDNVDRGDTPAYWTHFHSLYNSVKGAPKMYLAIGNHEYIGTDKANGLSSFLANVTLPDGTHPTSQDYDVWVNGYHYVFIGSNAGPGKAQFSQTQMLWLEDVLSENRNGQPIFLFLHQPMENTVSGSSTEEGWSGVTTPALLKAVLDKFPEVIMFNGHTHWILDSDNCMYDGKGETASIFNTSSVAYLWHSYDVATGERMVGSEGYYIRVYEDKVLLLGRNFETGEWVSSAQFVVEYTATKDNDTTNDTTSSCADTTTKSPDSDTHTNAPDVTTAPDTTTKTKEKGCASFGFSAITLLVSVFGLALFTFKKKY